MTREEAIQILERRRFYSNYGAGLNEALDMAIEALSADTVSRSQYHGLLNAIGKVYVEVVRCKDCIYWQSGDMGTGEVYEPYCEMLDTETDANAFCSDGERREHGKHRE